MMKKGTVGWCTYYAVGGDRHYVTTGWTSIKIRKVLDQNALQVGCSSAAVWQWNGVRGRNKGFGFEYVLMEGELI